MIDAMYVPVPGDSIVQQLATLSDMLQCGVCVPLLHWHHGFLRASVLMRVHRKRKGCAMDGKVNVLATAALHLFSCRDTAALVAVGPAFVVFEAYSSGGSWECLCPATEQAAAMVLDHLMMFERPGVPPLASVWGAGSSKIRPALAVH